jgi:hypothetical protein
MKSMGLEAVEPGIQVQYRPSPEDDRKCYEFGKEFAKKVIEYHQKQGGTVPAKCKL